MTGVSEWRLFVDEWLFEPDDDMMKVIVVDATTIQISLSYGADS